MEPGHDHGLARAGLAGHDGEPWAEFKGGIVDHAEAPDTDLLEHERILATPGG
jgi:hypothetical protein